MSFKRLSIFPFLWTALFIIAIVLLFDSTFFAAFLRIEISIVKLLALAGAWAAAMSYERGAYLRRAWFLIGMCMLFLLVRDALVVLDLKNVRILSAILVGSANLVKVIGTWLLARSWRVAELALPGTKGTRLAVLIVVIGLALGVAAPPLVDSARAILAGDISEMTSLASGAGDFISLCLIAPLLFTAFALRGGMFVWPWSLITISYVCWLFYDASSYFGPLLGLQDQSARAVSEVFRALGCLFQFSAGMSQRLVNKLIRG